MRKGVLDLLSGLENRDNSIGVCCTGVLGLISDLKNSCNSIGVCSKGVLDLMSGSEDSGFPSMTIYFPTLYHQLYNHGINACGCLDNHVHLHILPVWID